MTHIEAKTCSACGVEKPLGEFYKSINQCKVCRSAKIKEWGLKNKERKNAIQREYYRANKDAINEKQKQICKSWYAKNKESVKSVRSAYAKKNNHKINTKEASRRAKKLAATPTWANKEKIAVVYEYAKLCTFVMKKAFHVDHIVPLVSTKICGLHVEKNLQVLEASQNISKKNHHWPDMWQKEFVCQ